MRCKIGDKAFIIGGGKSEKDKEDFGRIVKILRPFGDGVSWWIRALDKPLSCGVFEIGEYDSNLLPIPPDETPEQSIEAMKLLHQLPKETV